MSKRANGRASGPVLTSGVLAVLDHSDAEKIEEGKPGNRKKLSASQNNSFIFFLSELDLGFLAPGKGPK